MRIATIHGRVALIDGAGSGAVDVEMASGGRFGPEPAGVYERWTEFAAWAGFGAIAATRGNGAGIARFAIAEPAAGVRFRAQLQRPRGRIGLRPPGHLAAGLHEVPVLYY
jgi:hypothetical protein